MDSKRHKSRLSALLQQRKDRCPACEILYRPFDRTHYDMWHVDVAASAADGCEGCTLLKEVLDCSFSGTAATRYELIIRDAGAKGLCALRLDGSFTDDTGKRKKLTRTVDIFVAPLQSEARYQQHDLSLPRRPWVRSSRIHPGNTRSNTSLDQARLWVDRCRRIHTECLINTDVELPTRLLRLEETGEELTVRLEETAGCKGSYACLSHCWGSKQPLRLLSTNTNDFLQRIEMFALPQTFQDALKVTRLLDLQYIWIDSLCIIQDSKEDWEHEAARMCQVYENAYVTIAAATAADGDAGLFSSEDQAQRPKLLRRVPGRHGIPQGLYVRPAINHLHAEDRLWTRAWVYQERLLSPRLLKFGPREISFLCRHGHRCECGVFSFDFAGRDLRGLELPTFSGGAEGMHTMISRYTRLNLTHQTDRLAALQGLIAKEQSRRKTNCRFGIFEDTLLHDLSWYTYRPSAPSGCEVPRWSWAFGTNGILSQLMHTGAYRGFVELKNRESTPLQHLGWSYRDGAPCGAADLDRWRIKLSGRLIRSRLYRLESGKGDVEFDAELEDWLSSVNVAVHIDQISDLEQVDQIGQEVFCCPLVARMSMMDDLPSEGSCFLVLRRVVPGQDMVFERIGLRCDASTYVPDRFCNLGEPAEFELQ